MLRVSVAHFHSARHWRSEALEERDGRRFVAGRLRTSGRGRNEAADMDHGGAPLAISPRSRRGEAVRAYPHPSVNWCRGAHGGDEFRELPLLDEVEVGTERPDLLGHAAS